MRVVGNHGMVDEKSHGGSVGGLDIMEGFFEQHSDSSSYELEDRSRKKISENDRLYLCSSVCTWRV